MRMSRKVQFYDDMRGQLAMIEDALRDMAECGRAVDMCPAALRGHGASADIIDLDDVANDVRRIGVEFRRMAAQLYAEQVEGEEGITLPLDHDPDTGA